MENEKKIKGYKGFNPDMTCRGFKYEVGKEYQTDEAKVRKTGFHFCESPMDVWGYYPPCNEKGQLNRFCEVEGSGDIDNSDKNKTACTHIKISAEIGIKGIIRASVKYILNSVKKKQGDYARSTVKGKAAIAVSLGEKGMAKGALGCWIVITEYDDFNGNFFPIKCVKAFKVDGKKIKADTFYKLENGKAVEVKE